MKASMKRHIRKGKPKWRTWLGKSRIDCLHRRTKESHAQDNLKSYIGNHHAYEIVKFFQTTSHINHNSQQKTMHGERACKIANSINFNIFIEFSGQHFR